MYKGKKTGWMKHWDFTLMDLICIQLSWIISYMLRHGWHIVYGNMPYRRMAVIMVLIDIVIVFFNESYSGIIRRTFGQEAKQSAVSGSMVFVGMIIYLMATKQTFIFSRQVLLVYWVGSIFAIWFGRTILKRFVRIQLTKSKNRSVMIVVTASQYAEEIIKNLTKDPYTEYAVEGLVLTDVDRVGESIRGVPVVAVADTFYDYVRLNVVDEVFVNGNSRESTEVLADELIEMGITVHYNLVNQKKLLSDRMVGRCGSYLVLTSSMHIASPSKLLIKRVADILGGIVGLLITAVLFVIFAPMIKLQSPGTIFFAQERVGQNGRRFKLYKFRSMYMDAEERKKELMEENEMQGHMFKLENDPRVFPIGKVMRKFSLDEFPQFWNVLKGDMSMVGTRPPTVDEFEKYDVRHKARLGYKPGLTGMWQVSGRNEITDFEEVVALDTKYITEWSLGLDFQIIMKTIQVVITGKGS